jgi:segregation and condensation protein A
MATTQNGYQIHLPQFEGPFDLLLFFIERDELDIRDISISKITHDFIEYLHYLEQHTLDIASEFIVMAAKLLKIKASMLLPRPAPQQENALIDPRVELMDRLVEYKRFKMAMESLQDLESLSNLNIKRGYVSQEIQMLKGIHYSPKEELFGLSLFQLCKVFQKIMQKHELKRLKPKHVIQRYPYTIEEVREQVLLIVKNKKKVDFLFFIELKKERFFLVFCFLCVLDLVQQKFITVTVGQGYNNFWLHANEQNPA